MKMRFTYLLLRPLPLVVMRQHPGRMKVMKRGIRPSGRRLDIHNQKTVI